MPIGGVVLTAAGAALVVGSFMPWLTVRAAFVGQLSVSGVDDGGDGLFTAGAGLLCALIGVVYLLKRQMTLAGIILPVVAGGVAAAVCLYDMQEVDRRSRAADGADFAASVTTGSGLWLCLAAGVATIVGAALMYGERSARKTRVVEGVQ